MQWTAHFVEAINTPNANGFTYVGSTTATFAPTSIVSGSGKTWSISGVHFAGNTSQAGDPLTLMIAGNAVVDLAGNSMVAPASSNASMAVTFGLLALL